MTQRTTSSIRHTDVSLDWILFDATDIPLGRLAVAISNQLIGKFKPTYTPHVDGGNYVVVINSDRVSLSGKKLQDKTYYRHSQHPGSLKEERLEHLIARDSTLAVRRAVDRMLPKNKLRQGRMARLHIYSGDEHAHTAQKPLKKEIFNG